MDLLDLRELLLLDQDHVARKLCQIVGVDALAGLPIDQGEAAIHEADRIEGATEAMLLACDRVLGLDDLDAGILVPAVEGSETLRSLIVLLEGEVTYDVAKLIIDNEIAKYVENILRGIEVNDEALCVDLIKDIGIGGNFLETEQTLKLFKTEHDQTELFDRRARGVWDTIEEKSMYDKALKIANDIISQKSEPVLSDKITGEIEEIYLKYLNGRNVL